MEWIDNYPKYAAERKIMRETNDCTVVSFAEVWGIPYENAHKHIKNQFKRRHRGGVKARENVIANCPKTKIKKGPYTQENRISLGAFAKTHNVGRYWVFVRGHALAVIDGVIHDHSHKPRRQVIGAYRVYPRHLCPEWYDENGQAR
jgi:hypothetical protein